MFFDFLQGICIKKCDYLLQNTIYVKVTFFYLYGTCVVL